MAERQDGRNATTINIAAGGGGRDVQIQQRKSLSRLQQRAPVAIKVSLPERFAKDWQVAIPLLSPLDVSSPGLPFGGSPNTKVVVVEKVAATPTMTSMQENESSKPLLNLHQCHPQQHPQKKQTNSFMMWQHPASSPSPFHFDSTPSLMSQFVHDWRLGGAEGAGGIIDQC